MAGALAVVLGAERLELAYWLPDAERWIDQGGSPRAVDTSQPGVILVNYRGRRVAALIADPPSAGQPDLDGSLVAAVGLALEAERLKLALHSRLDEQQALRRVATAVARQHEREDILSLVATEVARHLAADAGADRAVRRPWSRNGARRVERTGRRPLPGGTADRHRRADGARPGAADRSAGAGRHLRRDAGRLSGGVAAARDAGERGRADPRGRPSVGRVRRRARRPTCSPRTRRRASARSPSWSRRRSPTSMHGSSSRSRAPASSRPPTTLAGGSSAISMTAPSSGWSRSRCRCGSWPGRPSRPPRRRSRPASRICRRRSRSCASSRAESIRCAHRARPGGGPAGARRAFTRAGRARRRPRRPPAAAHEAALYFVAAEALTNVAKYAERAPCEVTLHGDDRWAEITVADDGVGGARAEDGSGLRGLGDRVEALGGKIAVDSPPGEGTTIQARVPTGTSRADVAPAR